MHVTIQIPITDLRPTVDNSAPRLAAPDWANLTSYRDFTRGFGEIEDRQRGVGAVSGDDKYVSARKAIRMVDGFGSKPIKIGACDVMFECTFRRFFYDGEAAARFEIGFTLRRSTQRKMALAGQSLDVALAIKALLDVKCQVSGVEKPVAIRDLAKPLADLWIRSTTPQSADPKETYRYWVTRDLLNGKAPAGGTGPWAVPGQPVVVVETKPAVPLQVKGDIVKIPDDYGKLPEAVYFLRPNKNLQVPVWIFGWQGAEAFIGSERSKPIRHLRMLLLRTHSDRVSVWSLANYLARRQQPPSAAEIDRFADLLATKSGLLAPRASVYAKEKYGILDWNLCMMAHEIEKTSVPDFEADLEKMKKCFPEKVVEMLEKNEGFRRLETRLNLVVVQNTPGKLGPSITVLGDVVGSTLVIADQIKDSFNAPGPAKAG